ncbi:LytR C-terminal domain-containing protein [Streptomyces gamaensis]|uniref:LytR C-terminal domain-containing protein n=1 Tax=Streptomyces gamaensis TaxID=1763542 RepID=A0ABW0YTS2_9ACTN
MSMLTPPGMGGKYRITGHRFPHMRRPRNRRRIVLAVFAAAAALSLAGWGTLQLVDVFTGGGSTTQAARDKGAKGIKVGDCKSKTDGQPATRPLPRPADITVNVYNATPRAGLAKTTADELKQRGFRIGKVGNAPSLYDKKVETTGLLIGSPTATDAALRVLGTQVSGTQTKNDQRQGDTDVDLVIGNQFKNLAGKPDADKALSALGVAPANAPGPAPSAVTC